MYVFTVVPDFVLLSFPLELIRCFTDLVLVVQILQPGDACLRDRPEHRAISVNLWSLAHVHSVTPVIIGTIFLLSIQPRPRCYVGMSA